MDAGASEASANDGSDVASCDPVITAKPPNATLDAIEGQGPDFSWWIVTSGQADGGAPIFMPPASPPAPSPTTADGRTFLHLTGSGLGPIDYGVLGFSPRPSLVGGNPTDLSDGPGLTFDAKGSNLTVLIQTADTVPRFCRCAGTDCFNGYRSKVAITNTWATYTVTWDQFKLPSFVVNQVALDPKNIGSISFGGLGEDFDVSIDNLKIASAVPGDGGSAD